MSHKAHAVVEDEDYDDERDDDGDDDAWAEMDDERTEPALCLFCDTTFETSDAVFAHCRADHGFQINRVCHMWKLDCFGYIKMINFIRSKRPTTDLILCPQNRDKPPWESDDFMQPVNPEDPMLQYDIEDIEANCETDNTSQVASTSNGPASKENGPSGDLVTMTTSEHEALLLRLQRSEERLRQCEENLEGALLDMDSIKEKTRELMLSQSTSVVSQSGDDGGHSSNPDNAEEDPYFSSYGHFSIHEEMLKDTVRTETYRDFMYRNPDVFKDKIVLDVGCGTGILSMFAVQAGAKHVYAVDMAEIIYQAMDIVRENKFSDKITFIKGKLEDIKLPVEKVDIIISEWMGYFLLFESMLDSILFARAKYLKHDGAVYPDRCNISIAAISDLDLYNKHVTFWDDVYGFKMTSMKSCVVQEASVEVVNQDRVITDVCVIKELDICGCGLEDLQFTSSFSLTVNRPGHVTALIGYFDAFFEKNCSLKLGFSTGPASIPTHWKQTVFLLDTPLQCQQGEVLQGQLSCRKNRKDTRSLIIHVTLNDKHYTYFME